MDVDVKVSVNRAAVDRMLDRVMRPYLTTLTERVAIRARVTAPHVTYNLRSKIDAQVDGVYPRLVGRVVANTSYAAFVSLGTRPHVIRPRRRKALRFQSGGKVVFAKRVNHPGTRPNPYLVNALVYEVSR